jgi:hypothetical protein
VCGNIVCYLQFCLRSHRQFPLFSFWMCVPLQTVQLSAGVTCCRTSSVVFYWLLYNKCTCPQCNTCNIFKSRQKWEIKNYRREVKKIGGAPNQEFLKVCKMWENYCTAKSDPSKRRKRDSSVNCSQCMTKEVWLSPHTQSITQHETTVKSLCNVCPE